MGHSCLTSGQRQGGAGTDGPQIPALVIDPILPGRALQVTGGGLLNLDPQAQTWGHQMTPPGQKNMGQAPPNADVQFPAPIWVLRKAEKTPTQLLCDGRGLGHKSLSWGSRLRPLNSQSSCSLSRPRCSLSTHTSICQALHLPK